MSDTASARPCPECSLSCAADSQYCPSCGFPVGAVSIASKDPLIGAVLPGSYQIIDILGVGGMGRVYRAEQRTLGRTVAIKVIHPHLSSDEKSLARFLTEARATSRLNHPNSVSVIDFGKTEAGQPYLVMEFLRGQNLAQVASQEGLLPIPRICNILKQVLSALGEAHEQNIIHRDLKPENIVLDPLRRGGDFVKVVDFGLAKLKAEGQGSSITLPGIVCGTPDFMAPEQGRGDPLDGRSDLYAVGVVLFWMLAGRLPFKASNPTQVVMMHITMPVPDVRDLVPDRQLSDGIVDTMLRALAKDPSKRFPDAQEFIDALDDVLLEFQPTPSQRAVPGSSLPPGTPPGSLVPYPLVACGGCNGQVPHAAFCFDCGARLPSTSQQESAPGSLPLLGREEELRWLEGLLDTARHKACTARVVGEMGCGKTRLLEEFLRSAGQGGCRVLHLTPDPFWAGVSGHVLRSFVGRLLPTEVLSLSAPDDSKVRAVLAELLEDLPANKLAPALRWNAYADALDWSLDYALSSQTNPMVIVLDDMERMDLLSLRAIRATLEKRGNRGKLLLVGAHSPRFEETWGLEHIRVLSGLPAHVATDLLQRKSGGSGIALAEVGTTGIPPLYVSQVLGFGLDGGNAPPARLGDLIAQRLATLDPEERAWVQALAVLGDTVPSTTLAAFLADGTDRGSPFKDEVGDRLLRACLVSRTGAGEYSLVHPLFHKIALQDTPVEARRSLHRRAGRVYRKLGAPIEVLAEHSTLSQDAITALSLLEQCAAASIQRGDDLTATQHLRQGLNLVREEIYRGELEDPLRAMALFGKKLGSTLMRLRRFPDAKGVLLEVLDHTAPLSPERTEVLAQLAEIAQRESKLEDARGYLKQALAVAEQVGGGDDELEGLRLRLLSVGEMAGDSEGQLGSPKTRRSQGAPRSG